MDAIFQNHGFLLTFLYSIVCFVDGQAPIEPPFEPQTKPLKCALMTYLGHVIFKLLNK